VLYENHDEYGLIPDEHDLFDLWEGREPDLEPRIIDTKIEDGKATIRFTKKGIWEWDHAEEIRLQKCRRLLEKFDVKVVAFPDRIEIHGLIPTQIIERQGAKVFASANSTIRATSLSSLSPGYGLYC
jgi:hypothetical protein